MLTLVKRARRQQVFFKDTFKQRLKEEKDYESQKDDLPPAFNKRLYSVQGSEGVVITGASMDVMTRNSENIGNINYKLTESELKWMKCVVEGLKRIHRGLAFVKEVLSHVVTLETYEPLQYVRKKSNAEATFCYYILDGAVEATYDGSHGQKLQIYEPDVLYTHRSGEYLGLVTYEGEDKDMAPAATIYTKVHVQLIRINRKDFHDRIDRLREELDDEKRAFIEDGGTILKHLPEAQKKEILIFMSKEAFGANQIIIEQKQLTDYIYFVSSGHCDCVKRLYLQACGQRILLNVGHLNEDGSKCCHRSKNFILLTKGDFFGEDRVTHDIPNYYSVVTKTHTVCFKIHRAAFETGGRLRNALMKLIWEHKPTYPSLDELKELGMATYSWEVYKRLEATNAKNIHEDRQRVLQNTNLKYDDTNVMLDFLKGEFGEKEQPRNSIMENLAAKYKDLLVQNELAHSKHPEELALLTSSLTSFYDDYEEEEQAEMKRNQINALEKKNQKRKAQPLKAFVEEEKRVLDSREIFKKFPGHLKPREGMLKLHNISNSKKKAVVEKKMTLVATEPDEIVVRAKNQIEELAQKVARKKALASQSLVKESPFYKEHELAYTHHLVSRYRSNVLERKLRRTRHINEDDIRRLKSKHAVEYIELGAGVGEEPEVNQNEVKESKEPEPDLQFNRNKSWRRGSIAVRRKKFVDKLTERLSSVNSLPALAKHGKARTGDNFLSVTLPGDFRRPSLDIEDTLGRKNKDESSRPEFKKGLLRTKTLPVIAINSKLLLDA